MSEEKIKVWPIPEIEDQPIPGVYEPPKKKFDYRNDKPDNIYEPETIPEIPLPRSITARELVSMSIDTVSKRILMQYQFGQSGSIQIGNYKNGTSGDVRISPNGIVGRNSAGQTTFAIDGTTGDASFLGTITSIAGNIGGWSITASELSNGNVKIQSSAERILFGSATAPLTGIGIFLGKDGADYEFRAGNPSGNYIHWDGTNLNIKGNILTGSIVAGYIQVGGAAGDVNSGGTTINGGKITTGSITASQIAAGTITASQIAVGTITGDKIAGTTITGDKITTGAITAVKIASGTITANEIATGTITADKIATNTITASQIASNMGELTLTADAGVVFKMPSGTGNSSGGLIIKDSGGVARLKMNNNAFITSFNRAFAAASNQNGAFGNDWFQMFCEEDINSIVAGTLELPNTNRMLIKRSGTGVVIRIDATIDRTGKIDCYEPIGLAVRAGTPGAASNYQGFMYYDTNQSDIVFSNGTNWYKIDATQI